MTDQEKHHYTECGLDDIWLVNGFEQEESPYGPVISIRDIDGLHRAIGERLARGTTDLSGREMRFLRHELDISQAMLSRLLGVDDQTVARWEKGKTVAPGPAQRLLRALYLSKTGDSPSISQLLETISQIDTDMDEEPMEMEFTADLWSVRAVA